ncbi:phosphoenolpyruvate carboxylase [Thermoleophilia bacterium SCSIO 60948]|nr:phosphoenolpyruvate carboxylase [Thermoleophilia bacterium SCSIO 60948]
MSADGRRTIEDDRELLEEVLAEVVRSGAGDEAFDLHERTVALAKRARLGDAEAAGELGELVAGLDTDELEGLVLSLVRWFQLVNLAEDNERIRRLHARDRREAPKPRPGSLRDAVARLAAAGCSAEEVGRLLASADLRLVITAHPTEARRRTTLEKLARIFSRLRDLDERPGVPNLEQRTRRLLLETVQELWGSDELRAVSPTVIDEVRAGLVYFVSTLADEVPEVIRDLEASLEIEYGDDAPEVPAFISFGSWIGGDRDGNPNVHPDTTIETLELMRSQCLRFLERRIGVLAERISISDRSHTPDGELTALLERGGELFPQLEGRLSDLNPEEPYRRAFTFIRERVRATRRGRDGAYADPGELLSDLRAADRALRESGDSHAAAGDLRDVIRQVEIFGFHFARLDVRENSKRHRDALAEVYSQLGILDGYAEADPERRAELLAGSIADHRPLIPADISGFSDETRETIELFRAIGRALTGRHRGTIETYVISHAEQPADVLEVLLLMKEASLTRAGGEGAMLRIAPLFESGESLDAAPETIATLLDTPVYRAALESSGGLQEVMVGYSDSNKDVGYVASGWATYRAQVRVAEVLREAGLGWLFFHGRGGAVGRGGGPTNVAIMALPAGTVGARLKMTEQGEVLAAKYLTAEIAHRELELTTSAVLASDVDGDSGLSDERRERFEGVLERMAGTSADTYRELVHGDPDFVEFFQTVTPVDEISRLQLGSRPAKRSPDGGVDDLRAIPWVFSWTQARIVLPAWYGLGTALAEAEERFGLDTLVEMQREWPFFSALLSNAEMACAKADASIASLYVDLWANDKARDRIWTRVCGELELTIRKLEAVFGEERLLDREPVLQASIDRRNPYVDPLSYIQVELLRRMRSGEATDGETERLGRVSLLAVNGIAGGLRNTG